MPDELDKLLEEADHEAESVRWLGRPAGPTKNNVIVRLAAAVRSLRADAERWRRVEAERLTVIQHDNLAYSPGVYRDMETDHEQFRGFENDGSPDPSAAVDALEKKG